MLGLFALSVILGVFFVLAPKVLGKTSNALEATTAFKRYGTSMIGIFVYTFLIISASVLLFWLIHWGVVGIIAVAMVISGK